MIVQEDEEVERRCCFKIVRASRFFKRPGQVNCLYTVRDTLRERERERRRKGKESGQRRSSFSLLASSPSSPFLRNGVARPISIDNREQICTTT